jgi:hypothetical protein
VRGDCSASFRCLLEPSQRELLRELCSRHKQKGSLLSSLAN